MVQTGLGHMTVPEFGKNFSHTLLVRKEDWNLLSACQQA
jgi:hypothetical protein